MDSNTSKEVGEVVTNSGASRHLTCPPQGMCMSVPACMCECLGVRVCVCVCVHVCVLGRLIERTAESMTRAVVGTRDRGWCASSDFHALCQQPFHQQRLCRHDERVPGR